MFGLARTLARTGRLFCRSARPGWLEHFNVKATEVWGIIPVNSAKKPVSGAKARNSRGLGGQRRADDLNGRKPHAGVAAGLGATHRLITG